MGYKLRPPTIAEIFAENLRRECHRFSSIAEFCRQSRINRQQFNRYLAGQNLPNPSSLQRICATLGVSEVKLFETQRPAAPRHAPGTFNPDVLGKYLPGLPPLALEGLNRVAAMLVGSVETKGVMPLGAYLAYMPLAGCPGQLVRVAMKVSQVDGLIVFTRRTSFRLPGHHIRSLTVGKHVGLVLSDASGTLFLGMNKIYPHELSAMRVMHSIANPGTPMLGVSLVRSPFGDLASKVVLSAQGSGRAAERFVLSQIGLTEPNDPTLPDIVAKLLPNTTLPHEVQHDYVAVNEGLQFYPSLNATRASRT